MKKDYLKNHFKGLMTTLDKSTEQLIEEAVKRLVGKLRCEYECNSENEAGAKCNCQKIKFRASVRKELLTIASKSAEAERKKYHGKPEWVTNQENRELRANPPIYRGTK